MPMTSVNAQDSPIRWEIRQLTIDANEGIDLGDINRDGHLDMVAGRNWYAAPDFVPRPLRKIDDWSGYVESNGDYLYDVNRDGWPDVIAGSFLPTQVYWYENPGGPGLESGHLWQQHLMVDTGNSQNEAQLLEDLDADDVPEWVVNSWNSGAPIYAWRFMPMDRRTGGDTSNNWERIEICSLGNGHGLGVGDLNGDGFKDILTGQGWFENPGSTPTKGNWKYRADWSIQASIPMLVRDLNGDALPDIIVGKGHDFGLYWWKQLPPDDDGKTNWDKILIDDRFSQPHCLHLTDLDGDGFQELITGKRVRAHNGNDPGGEMPPCLYYYRWKRNEQRFVRFVIDEGHVGTGLQIRTGDLNGDSRTDIAVAGKSGTYILFNRSQKKN